MTLPTSAKSLVLNARFTLLCMLFCLIGASLALEAYGLFDRYHADIYLWSAVYGFGMTAGALWALRAKRRFTAAALLVLAGVVIAGAHLLNLGMSPTQPIPSYSE